MIRIINPLIEALNTKQKLPHLIIVILDECIVNLGDYNVDDIIIIWFLSALWQAILTRINQLPIRAKLDSPPPQLVTVIKPIAKPNWADPDANYIRKREGCSDPEIDKQNTSNT